MKEDGELAYDEVLINATIFTDEPVKMNDINESLKTKLNLKDKEDELVTKINSGKLKEEKKSNAVVIEESPAKYYLDKVICNETGIVICVSTEKSEPKSLNQSSLKLPINLPIKRKTAIKQVNKNLVEVEDNYIKENKLMKCSWNTKEQLEKLENSSKIKIDRITEEERYIGYCGKFITRVKKFINYSLIMHKKEN